MKRMYFMMQRSLTVLLTVMALVATMLTACSGHDEEGSVPVKPEEPQGSHLLTATLAPRGVNGSWLRTRTISDNGKAAWEVGEHIAVYYETMDGGQQTAIGEIKEVGADGSATLRAWLDNPKEESTAQLVSPATLHNGEGDIDVRQLLDSQYGQLEKSSLTTPAAKDISSYFNAATAQVNISISGNTASTDGTVTMESQVCICKFILSFEGTMTAEKLTVMDGQGRSYTINSDRLADEQPDPMHPAFRGFRNGDVIWVAMLPANGKLWFHGSNAEADCYALTSPATLEAGRFYDNMSAVTLSTKEVAHEMKTITIAAGDTLRLNNVNISVDEGPAIMCEGTATIVLVGENTLTSTAKNYPAIAIGTQNSLFTLMGSGSLTAQGGENAAGIGPCKDRRGGDICIESGTITAQGGEEGAGIGCGGRQRCGKIVINGGTVTATGGKSGAGIGVCSGHCDNIVINGGTVMAKGRAGTGIGCNSGSCENVYINGGTVTAIGGGLNAPGIGANWGSCQNVYIGKDITSVTVTITGDGNSKAYRPIGKGDRGTIGRVYIEDIEWYEWSADNSSNVLIWEQNTEFKGAWFTNTWTIKHK